MRILFVALVLLLLSRQPVTAQEREKTSSKSTGMEFIVVPPGDFVMGSPETEMGFGNKRRSDETQHKVKLTKTILLGRHEVTQDEFEKVMKYNPSKFKGDPTKLPAEEVSWYEAVMFCNRLSELDGREPFYEITKIEKSQNNITKAEVKAKGGKGYRLPTEAEWEYACRAGTTSTFAFGDSLSFEQANLDESDPFAGKNGRSRRKTVDVRMFEGNAWGFKNMHGNVWEWCWDFPNPDTKEDLVDPDGRTSGSWRVTRGGAFQNVAGVMRSAHRNSTDPSGKGYDQGFRVAATLSE